MPKGIALNYSKDSTISTIKSQISLELQRTK